MEWIFDFGDLLKDQVTGYEGIVLGRTEYATGYIHYGLQAQKLKDDGTNTGDWQWFDQSRLVLKEKQVVKFNLLEKPTSGPYPNAPQA